MAPMTLCRLGAAGVVGPVGASDAHPAPATFPARNGCNDLPGAELADSSITGEVDRDNGTKEHSISVLLPKVLARLGTCTWTTQRSRRNRRARSIERNSSAATSPRLMRTRSVEMARS
jgi:hypothetical protein